MNSLSVQILSVPYREKLIAEIQFKNHVIAEISHDGDDILIEAFSYDDIRMQFPLEEYIGVLKEAKEKFGRTVWGGFDNRPGSLIYTGTKEEIEAEVKRLVEASSKRGYIIGPDCSIHDELPEERIKWIVDAARKL